MEPFERSVQHAILRVGFNRTFHVLSSHNCDDDDDDDDDDAEIVVMFVRPMMTVMM